MSPWLAGLADPTHPHMSCAISLLPLYSLLTFLLDMGYSFLWSDLDKPWALGKDTMGPKKLDLEIANFQKT